jgi:predicted rRNA methylase
MKKKLDFKKRRSEQIADPRGFRLDSLAALREFLTFKPRDIVEIRCQPNMLKPMIEEVQRFGLSGKIVGTAEKDAVHPFTAIVKVEPIELEPVIKESKNLQKDLILALDHITDTRNVGAIIRSAAFFGVKHVIAPTDRQSLVTQAAVATAMGGFALTNLVAVVNLGRALEELKEEGYWIIGADMEGESYTDLVGTYEKTVLVLGSEDKGISAGVLKKCDRMVKISGAKDSVESLNVSVAAGILLERFRIQ